MTVFSGGCLCGAVRYEGREATGGGHCFCIDCRRSSGTSHGSHMMVPESAFKLTGELSSYASPADSGNLVTRFFCPTCGSPICSSNSGFAGLVFVRASSLDIPNVFQPQMSVYTNRAPRWAKVDPDLPQFEEMPGGGERPR